MSDQARHAANIPEWYLDIFHATQHSGGALRQVESELRALLEIDGLDARVGSELAALLSVLQCAIGELVLVDGAARLALDERLRKAA